MKNALEMKHGQVFLFVYVLPFIFSLIVGVYLIRDIVFNMGDGPISLFATYSDSLQHFGYFAVLTSLPILIWWIVLVRDLDRGMNSQLRYDLTPFYLCLLTIIGLSLASAYVSSQLFSELSNVFQEGSEASSTEAYFEQGFTDYETYNTLISLASFFISLYLYFFIARSHKTIEVGARPKWSDCLGETALYMFYFIGVWFTQPRLNRLRSIGLVEDGDALDSSFIERY